MNSERLRRYVLAELASDPRFDASGVEVSVDDRVVTLSGQVPGYMDKWAIQHAVLALKGVRDVVTTIEVKCPVDCMVPDEDIARRANRRLAWNSAIPHDAVGIAVANGWVTLTGTVDWQFQRVLAEQDVQFLSGVRGITNSIALRPLPPRGHLESSIEDALRRRAGIRPSEVQVRVEDGGRVTLRGKVDDCHERTAIEDAVWTVAGVRRVDDQIKVR